MAIGKEQKLSKDVKDETIASVTMFSLRWSGDGVGFFLT
jgi:hypothetical protein